MGNAGQGNKLRIQATNTEGLIRNPSCNFDPQFWFAKVDDVMA
jgi:hypothetical protein